MPPQKWQQDSSSVELDGEVEVSSSGDLFGESDGIQCSKVSLLASRYPMKIWVPQLQHASSPCTWLFGMQFGGGLVEGDDVRCRITVREKCSAVYASLGQNKAYSCAGGREMKQKNDFCVERGAFLFVLPDPTLLQKGSALVQQQIVTVVAEGNLVLLDWYIAGRSSLQEHWEGASLRSLNSILLNGEEIFRDVMHLTTSESSGKRLKTSMGKYQIIGLCVVMGDRVVSRLVDVLKTLSVGNAYGTAVDTNQIVSCSPLYVDASDTIICGHVIRFCFSTTITAYESIAEILKPIFEMAGGNPFEKSY